MATLTEKVVLDRVSPTRVFADTIRLRLEVDGVPLSSTITQVVLTLTSSSGTQYVLDSADSDFVWSWSAGVLTLDLSASDLAVGWYQTALDAEVGNTWYRWTLLDSLEIIVE